MTINKKETLRYKRHTRIRLKMFGTQEKPRLTIRRSLKNLQAQFFDDVKNKVLFSLSTKDKLMKPKIKSGGNVKGAVALGEALAEMAKEKGITKIVFDRAGYLYHGRVKAFAEALRKGGLQF